MWYIAANVESAALMSIYKPIVYLLCFFGWAAVVSFFDKDLKFYFLPRRHWNALQIIAGIIGFGLALLVNFWLGLLIILVVAGSAAAGYVFYRNTRLPEQHRWHLNAELLTSRFNRIQHEQAQKRATLRLLTPDRAPVDVPTGADPQAHAHSVLEQTLEFALPRGADRIDIAVMAQAASIGVNVDGVKHTRPEIDSQAAMMLIDYAKKHAQLDIQDRRHKQIGEMFIDAADLGRHTLRVVTSGSTRGITMAIYIDPMTRITIGFDDMGLLPEQAANLRRAVASDNLAVLIACPPHHGLTTALYNCLQQHDPYTQSVVTLEEEVAFDVEGVNHHLIEPSWNSTQITDRLAALLRQDPSVLMLSKLTDSQVARLLSRNANETRLYIGLHLGDTVQVMRAWTKAVDDSKLAAQSVAAVLVQRLVRKLCRTCRVCYTPDRDVLRKLNLPPDKVTQMYKQSGQILVRNKPTTCPDCHGLGFRGRTGIFEVMELDDETRKLWAAGQVEQFRALLRKKKMLWLQEAALMRVIDGTTSIQETMRALGKTESQRPTAVAG